MANKQRDLAKETRWRDILKRHVARRLFFSIPQTVHVRHPDTTHDTTNNSHKSLIGPTDKQIIKMRSAIDLFSGVP